MPNHKERIELNDTMMDVMQKLAEGNFGAASVLKRVLSEGKGIDPDCGWGEPFFMLLNIDSCGIYGAKLWTLYKEVCKENLSKMIACLRACQLGILSTSSLHEAVENRAGLDVEDVCKKVTDELPNFKVTE